jgi:hypothetical protein
MGHQGLLKICVVFVAILTWSITHVKSAIAQTDAPIYDSTELKQDSIYICDNHFFEWCTEESSCAHCNENLTRFSLWDYYKKLECEDCKNFFEENYYLFKPGI